MFTDSKTIIDFIQESPEALKYITIIIIAFIMIIIIINALMIYNTDSDDTLNRSIELNELNELNELEEFDMKYVIKKHEYSKNNYLYIYNIGIRICRVGVFVSDYINNVNFISCSKDDQDRILYIEYVNDNGDVRKEEISCGVMSDLEYNIVKKLIYEYVRL